MDNVDICQRPQPRLHVIPGDLSKAHAVHTLSYLISGEGSEALEKRISKKTASKVMRRNIPVLLSSSRFILNLRRKFN